MGVGDCGGLQLIPGLTKNGVQARPMWLDELMGMKPAAKPLAADGTPLPIEGVTMDSFFSAEDRK